MKRDDKTEKTLPIRILLATFTLIVLGVTTGAGASFVSNLFYLVILFPVIMGAIGAWALNDTIKRSRFRTPVLTITLSILMGILIYGTYHFVNYLTFREKAKTVLVEQATEDIDTSSLTNEEINNISNFLVDYALQEETGHNGFIGYMLLEAKLGVSIGKIYSSNSLNLGPFFTWLYWLMELVIITAIIFSSAKSAANQPFCDICQDWIKPKEHLGGVNEDKFDILPDLIQQKRFSEAGRLLKPSTGIPSIEVYAKSCGCETSELKLSQASFDANDDVVWEDILDTTVSSAQLAELRQKTSA